MARDASVPFVHITLFRADDGVCTLAVVLFVAKAAPCAVGQDVIKQSALH